MKQIILLRHKPAPSDVICAQIGKLHSVRQLRSCDGRSGSQCKHPCKANVCQQEKFCGVRSKLLNANARVCSFCPESRYMYSLIAANLHLQLKCSIVLVNFNSAVSKPLVCLHRARNGFLSHQKVSRSIRQLFSRPKVSKSLCVIAQEPVLISVRTQSSRRKSARGRELTARR